jgi:hypothetical protein
VKRNERPTLAEEYSNVTSHGALSLPAQSILAASAWTGPKVGCSTGATLIRLRTEWESKKPSPHAVAMLPGGPRKNRRLLKLTVLDHLRKSLRALRLLQNWPAAHEALTVHGACEGLDDPIGAAEKGLRYWLEHPQRPPDDRASRLMWTYIEDCIADEAKNLRAGMRGHTKHEA